MFLLLLIHHAAIGILRIFPVMSRCVFCVSGFLLSSQAAIFFFSVVIKYLVKYAKMLEYYILWSTVRTPMLRVTCFFFHEYISLFSKN